MADTTYSRKDLLALGANQKALAEKDVVEKVAKMLGEHSYTVRTGTNKGFFSFRFRFTIHAPFRLTKEDIREAVMASELFEINGCYAKDPLFDEEDSSILIDLSLEVIDPE